MSPALTGYRVVTALAHPLARAVLRRRAADGKEDPARLGERLGRASRERPDGEVVWLHGASVGETQSLLPLIRRLRERRPDLFLLVTSGTTTSAQLLAERLPGGAVHQFVPLDTPFAARRFLDHWRPATAVFVDSELWPNLLLGAEKRGVRSALLGARLSADSTGGWAKAPAAARRLLRAFDLILAQDMETRSWIERHGVDVPGLVNLKLAGEPLGHDPHEFLQLRAAFGDRPPIVVVSTHPGEEEVAADAWLELPPLQPPPALVIAPRHPRRGPAVAALLRERGIATTVRSEGEGPTADAYVADTLGELGLFFQLARLVVMGGGFDPEIGGHNPLEPARLGAPVLSGPHVANFREVYAAMAEERAVRLVEGSALASVLTELLQNPHLAEHLGEAGLTFARRANRALDEAWDALQPLLPPAPQADPQEAAA